MDSKLCSFEGCTKTYEAKGLCISHYSQQRRGRPLTPIGEAGRNRECDLEGCHRRRTSSGLCKGHLGQERAGQEFSNDFKYILTTDIKHGLPHTYTKFKCRCELCVAAWNAATKARREAGKLKTFGDDWEHGVRSTFSAGCRCRLCKLASSQTVSEVSYIKRRIDKEETIELQGGVCACCFQKPRAFVLDHIHGTTHFRGYLCNSCNTGIGKLGDNVAGLERAIEYLKRSTPTKLLTT